MNAAPAFRYTLDEDYLETAYARTIASLPRWARWRKRGLDPLATFVVAGVLCWLRRDDWTNFVIVPLIVIGVFVYGALKARKDRREQYYQTELEDAPVCVTCSERGLEVEAPECHVRTDWNALTRARAFPDGWLLTDAPRIATWLPRSGLSAGTPDEVDALLRANIGDYAEIPGRAR